MVFGGNRMAVLRGNVLRYLFVFWAVSCSSAPRSISADNYRRDCVTAADCSVVFEGVVHCCGGGCPNTAIRADEVAAFMTALEAAREASCNGVQPPCPSPPVCGASHATCRDAQCEFGLDPLPG